MKYLDPIGLSQVWNEMNPHVIFYGVCSTIDNQQTKVVAVNGLNEVVEGTHLIIKFQYANTAEAPSLMLNCKGNTIGSIYPIIDENGRTISKVGAGIISNYCEFIYNGNGYWVLISSQFGNQIIYTETDVEPAGEEGMIWLKKISV